MANYTLVLNRAIGILSKIRHYVPKFILNTLRYTMFHSHLIYSCQIEVTIKPCQSN